MLDLKDLPITKRISDNIYEALERAGSLPESHVSKNRVSGKKLKKALQAIHRNLETLQKEETFEVQKQKLVPWMKWYQSELPWLIQQFDSLV